jgi:renalase
MTITSTALLNDQLYDLVIIGAGIAGLAAGRMAADAGLSCVILDKGRRVGGRVASRHSDGFTFNHGAQFVTADTDAFGKLLTDAEQAGAAVQWQIDKGKTVIVGCPLMRQLPGFLASGLTIHQNITIKAISRTAGHIQCRDDAGHHISARQVICTAPAPQTANLLAADFPNMAETAASAAYAPCWTVMLGLENDSDIPDMPVRAADHGIGWAMRETARPAATQHRPALTIQADADWSTAHLDDPAEDVIAKLITEWQHATGCNLTGILHARAHRWLYAKVIKTADPAGITCLNNLAVAGDWLGGARVEHAFTSGIQAFQALHAR